MPRPAQPKAAAAVLKFYLVVPTQSVKRGNREAFTR